MNFPELFENLDYFTGKLLQDALLRLGLTNLSYFLQEDRQFTPYKVNGEIGLSFPSGLDEINSFKTLVLFFSFSNYSGDQWAVENGLNSFGSFVTGTWRGTGTTLSGVSHDIILIPCASNADLYNDLLKISVLGKYAVGVLGIQNERLFLHRFLRQFLKTQQYYSKVALIGIEDPRLARRIYQGAEPENTESCSLQ